MTAGFALLAAIYTNRAEKKKTVESTVENVLTKHLDFKDDIISYKDEVISAKDKRIKALQEKNQEYQDKNKECEEAHRVKDFVIRELREQLDPEKRELDDS